MFCTLQLSKSNPTPLYIQLAQELSKLIKTGALAPHTKLPTIRSLSRTLGINRDTVVSAYKMLENQGLTIAYVGNGTYVSAPHTPSKPQPTAIACSSLGFPKHYFSTELLQEITSHVIANEGWDAFSDPLHRAKHYLRDTISTYLRSLGVEANNTQIRLIQSFNAFLPTLLKLHPNHCICVEAYHDLTATSFLRSLGIKLIEIPMTPDGMCLDTLQTVLASHQVAFIWVATYAQNPTGIHYAPTVKAEILRLAELHNCYILEDGTYSDFAYPLAVLKPMYAMDYSDRTIYLHHFSKLYLPHLSYSFIALPKHLASRLLDLPEYTFNERILHYYLQSSTLAQLRLNFILEMRELAHAIRLLFEQYEADFTLYSPHDSLFFWVEPKRAAMPTITSIFLEHHIIISPGELFCFKSKSPFFRFSIAQLTPKHLPILNTALKKISTLH